MWAPLRRASEGGVRGAVGTAGLWGEPGTTGACRLLAAFDWPPAASGLLLAAWYWLPTFATDRLLLSAYHYPYPPTTGRLGTTCRLLLAPALCPPTSGRLLLAGFKIRASTGTPSSELGEISVKLKRWRCSCAALLSKRSRTIVVPPPQWWPTCVRNRTRFGRTLALLADSGTMLVEVALILTSADQTSPSVGQFGPIWVDLIWVGPTLGKAGNSLEGQSCTIGAMICSFWAKHGPCLPMSAQHWSNSDQDWPITGASADVGRNCPTLRHMWPELDGFRTVSAPPVGQIR